MELDEAAQEQYEEFLNEVQELATSRCYEIDPVYPKESVPNAPNQEVSMDDLVDIEYLNSVHDVKLDLEICILELEMKLKQQELAAKRFERLESEHNRAFTVEMKDCFKLSQEYAVKAAHVMDMAEREAYIKKRLASCQAARDRRQAEEAQIQCDVAATEAALGSVLLSIAALTERVHSEGHETSDAIAFATATIEVRAEVIEKELAELHRQIAVLEARLQPPSQQ